MSNMGNFSSVGPVVFKSLDGAHPVSYVTADSAKKAAHLGTRITHQGEDYVYIYNAGASDASIGYGMVMSALSGYSLTVSAETGAHLPMGVVKHVSIPAGNYGWLLVRGISPVALASTMATQVLVTLGTDGVWSTFVVSTGAPLPVGQIISSGTGISTTGLGQAYLKCFG